MDNAQQFSTYNLLNAIDRGWCKQMAYTGLNVQSSTPRQYAKYGDKNTHIKDPRQMFLTDYFPGPPALACHPQNFTKENSR